MQLPRENRLFCSCLGLFAPSSCLQQLWGGRWKQLLSGLSSVAAGWGNSQQSCGLCPCSLLLPRPSPCSLTGFAVSFLSPLCHPWFSGLSVLLSGQGRAWHVAPCCPGIEALPSSWGHLLPPAELRLIPASAFSFFQDYTNPSLQWWAQSGGGSVPGRVPMPRDSSCHGASTAGSVWALSPAGAGTAVLGHTLAELNCTLSRSVACDGYSAFGSRV